MPLGRTSNVLDGRPVQKDAAGGIQIDWWSAGMSHNGKMQRARKSGAVSKALVVRPPWIEKILRRQKTWELRSRRTKARGPIGLIESRSGMVVGICDVVDVVGPLSLAALRRTVRYHKVPPTQLSKPRPYKKTYAWVLRHARRLNPPISYVHRSGAVVWVRLQSSVSRKIAQRT